MSDHPTCEHSGLQNGPWRLLVLDRTDPADPLWIVALVDSAADVRPADTAEADLDDVTVRWAASRHGLAHVTLTALPRAKCWRLDEAR